MSEGCSAIFQTCQNPNSVEGIDICPTVLWAPSIPLPGEHGKTPTCLWTSTMLWAPSFAIHGEYGETSHMRLTSTMLWAPTIILYPTAWATRLSSIRTLSLSLVRPSPSSIKEGVLSPNKEDQFERTPRPLQQLEQPTIDSPSVSFRHSKPTQSTRSNT